MEKVASDRQRFMNGYHHKFFTSMFCIGFSGLAVESDL
jgi:hypothetical protein